MHGGCHPGARAAARLQAWPGSGVAGWEPISGSWHSFGHPLDSAASVLS